MNNSAGMGCCPLVSAGFFYMLLLLLWYWHWSWHKEAYEEKPRSGQRLGSVFCVPDSASTLLSEEKDIRCVETLCH